jgi:hypothetical protein
VVAVDLLSFVLVVGVVALVVSTSIMIAGYMPAGRKQAKRRPPPSRTPKSARSSRSAKLSPGAERAMAIAEAKATKAHAALGVGTSTRPAASMPTGQIIDATDRLHRDREISADDAEMIAVHFADTDPQRVAEVISQWIRADSGSGPDDLF